MLNAGNMSTAGKVGVGGADGLGDLLIAVAGGLEDQGFALGRLERVQQREAVKMRASGSAGTSSSAWPSQWESGLVSWRSPASCQAS